VTDTTIVDAGTSADAGVAASAAATTTTTAAADAGAGTTTADKSATTIVGTVAATADAAKTAAVTTADATAKPGAWADNWRDTLAEQVKPGDAKFRERLNRLGSPADVTRSWLALEQKISSGEYKPIMPFPETGTPEQQASWRKDNGVPDAPDKYEVKLGNGMVVGEADKPVIEQFAKAVHGKNWSQQQFNDAVATYFTIQDQQAQQVKGLDDTYRSESEESLRAEWGGDFKSYTTAIDNFLGSLPNGVGELLANGRLADGRKIGADARVIKALKDIVFDLNPAASLLPAGSQTNSLGDEIDKIKATLRDTPEKYDAKMEARHIELIDAQNSMARRGMKAA
jgi:hypothetical protein